MAGDEVLPKAQRQLGTLVTVLGFVFAGCLALGAAASWWAGEPGLAIATLVAAVLAAVAFTLLRRYQRGAEAHQADAAVVERLADLHERGEVDAETLERARAALTERRPE